MSGDDSDFGAFVRICGSTYGPADVTEDDVRAQARAEAETGDPVSEADLERALRAVRRAHGLEP